MTKMRSLTPFEMTINWLYFRRGIGWRRSCQPIPLLTKFNTKYCHSERSEESNDFTGLQLIKYSNLIINVSVYELFFAY